jgi:methylmalonyl-CoA mutase cobalamin-binding subunit
MQQKTKTIVAGALGECVHVAGVTNFLRLAESAGWRTVFLGPAVSVEEMISAAQREVAELVGVSVFAMKSMIRIASIIHRSDYWRRGRTGRNWDWQNGAWANSLVLFRKAGLINDK